MKKLMFLPALGALFPVAMIAQSGTVEHDATGGEGWHNNHHAHPVSASHGMAWWEVDFNYWGIRLLALLGLAKNIKVMRPLSTPGDRTNPL
jgi:hypothetical protein